MTAPSLLLLLWAGAAATCVAAVVGVSFGGDTAAWPLAPRAGSRRHAIVWTIATGLVLYPLLYALFFEALHRASVEVGLYLGAAHGVVAFLVARPRATTRLALRCAVAHFVYGIVMAFLYVTP